LKNSRYVNKDKVKGLKKYFYLLLLQSFTYFKLFALLTLAKLYFDAQHACDRFSEYRRHL